MGASCFTAGDRRLECEPVPGLAHSQPRSGPRLRIRWRGGDWRRSRRRRRMEKWAPQTRVSKIIAVSLSALKVKHFPNG